MKSVIIFNCHLVNEESLLRYHLLTNKLDRTRYDIFWVLDVTKETPNLNREGIQFIPFNDNMYKNHYTYYSCSDGFHNRSIYSLFSIYDISQSYKYYWNIEYDAFYSGSFQEFVDKYNNDDSDLIGFSINKKCNSSDWYFWKVSTCIDEKYATSSFIPVTRMSNQLLYKCKEFLITNKISCFMEIFPATIASMNNMKFLDLRGSDVDGKFVFGESLHPSDVKPNKLYHPLKFDKHIKDFVKFSQN